MRNISIHTDEGMYILFRGPFPQILKDLADGRYRLDNHTDFVVPWLNREWPEWRQHIVRSENVPLPGERMPRRRS